MIIPNIWENKKWQPNHQPGLMDFVFTVSNHRFHAPFCWPSTSKLSAATPALDRVWIFQIWNDHKPMTDPCMYGILMGTFTINKNPSFVSINIPYIRIRHGKVIGIWVFPARHGGTPSSLVGLFYGTSPSQVSKTWMMPIGIPLGFRRPPQKVESPPPFMNLTYQKYHPETMMTLVGTIQEVSNISKMYGRTHHQA